MTKLMKFWYLPIIGLLLAACGLPSTAAQQRSSEEVVMARIEAMNAGDLEAHMALFADDAEYAVLPPPAEMPEPLVGKEAIRSRWEGLLAMNAKSSVEITRVDGNLVTTLCKYADDGLRNLGLEFIEGTEEYVIEDGKIAVYTWTTTNESMAELLAAMPNETDPTAKGTLVTTSEEMVGLWKYEIGGFAQYNADGTYISAASLYALENFPSVQAEYWFEEGRYVEKESDVSGLPSCGDTLGIYEVYLLEDGRLSRELVQDECVARAGASVGVLTRVD